MRSKVEIITEFQVGHRDEEDIESISCDLASEMERVVTDTFPDAYDVMSTVAGVEEVGE